MILAATLRGVEARRVRVTAARRAGLAALNIDGLAPAAARETRVRVQAALANTDHFIDDDVRIICDAGGTSVDGSATDLAAALAVATGSNEPLRVGALAELSLQGELRPVRGVLAAVEALREHVDVVLVASENAEEASLVEGVRVVAFRHLASALRFLAGDEREAVVIKAPSSSPTPAAYPDMRDIVGQPEARRALEVAAAGGHNLLLIGVPGAGKTMCARRLAGILPPMTEREALDVTRIHSAAGLNIGGGLVTTRPFRAPHHSTRPPGLIGGGSALPRPGEVSLAHHGVLFLDELPEFHRASLEVLHEPIASGEVILARASGTLCFPSRCHLVASTLPCPCGRFGDGSRCACSIDSRRRYLGRIPERLLDAIDLRVHLSRIDFLSPNAVSSGEPSASIAERVRAARMRLAAGDIAIDNDARGRAADSRALRVAHTLAALAGDDLVRRMHVEEAATLASAFGLPNAS